MTLTVLRSINVRMVHFRMGFSWDLTVFLTYKLGFIVRIFLTYRFLICAMYNLNTFALFIRHILIYNLIAHLKVDLHYGLNSNIFLRASFETLVLQLDVETTTLWNNFEYEMTNSVVTQLNSHIKTIPLVFVHSYLSVLGCPVNSLRHAIKSPSLHVSIYG